MGRRETYAVSYVRVCCLKRMRGGQAFKDLRGGRMNELGWGGDLICSASVSAMPGFGLVSAMRFS